MISIKNVQKTYNKGKKSEQQVLKDISLEFGNTGLVCILGESGSGKTTLLNTIGGLDSFESGSVTIGDVSVDGYRPKVMETVRNDRFGFVFQNYYLLSDYSVGYNVKLALNCYDMSEAEKDERTDYVLKMLGIDRYKKKKVCRLSGGQQQRVSIARVLVKAPDVIFADEPTGNLDEENTIRTMSILKNISKECLVLLVTHEKRIARFFADRIIEISDGRVVRDEENRAQSSYERIDDMNIYLPEYEAEPLQGSYGDFRMFARADERPGKIRMDMVVKDGKLYIRNLSDLDIVIAGDESGVKVVEEERAPLSVEDVNNFDYRLSRPEGRKASQLPGREIWRMAVENLKILGKKQFFMIAVLLATAVFLCLTLGEWLGSVHFDKGSVVSTDPHYLKVNFSNVSLYNENDQLQVLEFAWKNFGENNYGSCFSVPKIGLYLYGRDYEQLKNLRQQITGFCYVDATHLSKEKLVYGRMPELRNEAVIDISIVKKLIKSNGVVSSLYGGVEDYLGVNLATTVSETPLVIVGICDSGVPNIYCGQNILLSFDSFGYAVASFDEFNRQFPESALAGSLKDNEMYMRSGRLASLGLTVGDSYTMGYDKQHVYTIVGTVPDGLGIDYVMTDRACEYLRDLVIYWNKTAMFYTDDMEAAKQYISDAAKKTMKIFTTECEVPFDAEVQAYKEAIAGDFSAKQLITVVVAIVALVMIYFSVKSNIYSRSTELTVYRLIGISKGSIMRTYLLEMLLLTSATSLPASLAAWAVINLLNRIPGMETGLVLPFGYLLLLLAMIYSVHMLISVLPVRNLLAKPPAALAAKE